MSDAGAGAPDPSPVHLSFHQLIMFAPARSEAAELLEGSGLFRIRRARPGFVAEWVRGSTEADSSGYPMGQAVFCPDQVLLETFSSERMDALRRLVSTNGAGKISTDEVRMIRTGDAIADPGRLAGPRRSSLEIAELALRMGWPFLHRRDLNGRTPEQCLRTGRGRARVEQILPALLRDLRATATALRTLTAADLERMLLPPEGEIAKAPRRGEQPQRRP